MQSFSGDLTRRRAQQKNVHKLISKTVLGSRGRNETIVRNCMGNAESEEACFKPVLKTVFFCLSAFISLHNAPVPGFEIFRPKEECFLCTIHFSLTIYAILIHYTYDSRFTNCLYIYSCRFYLTCSQFKDIRRA